MGESTGTLLTTDTMHEVCARLRQLLTGPKFSVRYIHGNNFDGLELKSVELDVSSEIRRLIVSGKTVALYIPICDLRLSIPQKHAFFEFSKTMATFTIYDENGRFIDSPQFSVR